MKFHYWISLVVIVLLLAACSPATPTQAPVEPTGSTVNLPAINGKYPAPGTDPAQASYPAPAEAAAQSNYPAPGESDNLPAACKVDGMLTYSDADGRFCFAYPANFSLDTSGEGNPTLVGPALDLAAQPLRASMTIFTTPLAEGQDLKSIIEGYLAKYGQSSSSVVIQQNDLQIGGEPAGSLEPVPGEPGSIDYLMVHGGEVITLRFEPNIETYPAARPDREALIDIVLKSFSYLK
ncbi:MAG TPA: hypothetical protein VN452_04420 [Longilinea sp.]|nr:hypothetical protein [Longilinea sp.]